MTEPVDSESEAAASKDPGGDTDDPSEGGRRPFRPSGGSSPSPEEVARPELPADLQPRLPKGVMATIHQSDPEDPHAVAVALTAGSEALEAGEVEPALDYLRWAKQQAGAAPAIREALGVALDLDGSFREALAELRAYRRMSGRRDQNHLIGDCLRGLQRSTDEVADDIRAMLDDEDVPADRRLEGVIVWAGSVADDGDLDTARSVLRTADDLVHDLPEDDRGALVRLWYMEGDLADRAGEPEAARRHFAAVLEAEGQDFDARERLEGLPDRTG